MNEVQIFNNPEFGQVRSILLESEPWFVGKDVASALGYSDTFGALKKHVDKEDKQNCHFDSFQSPRGLTIINESGLYSLILSSKLPTAKKFKRWVTSEVLPAIRKQGFYITKQFAPKASSLGELVNLLSLTKKQMDEQRAEPAEVAQVLKTICKQFGVDLPNGFVKDEPFDMVDYIYGLSEEEREHATYDDYLKAKKSIN